MGEVEGGSEVRKRCQGERNKERDEVNTDGK